MTRYFTFLLIFFVLLKHDSFAQTELPAIFSDDMVLQQQQQVSIWGTDKPITKMSVSGSWGKIALVTSDVKGNWKLKLQTPVAGGPYTVIIKGSKVVTLKNVLIGEVWFCSGQSNMQMPVNGNYNQPIVGSNETILNSSNDKIRMFTQQHTTGLTPLYETKGVTCFFL